MAAQFGLLSAGTVLPHEIDGPVGWVGYLPANTTEAGLRDICSQLAAAGAKSVLGPLESSTWGPYRLSKPGDDDIPPFPGEPPVDERQLAVFTALGFSPILHYHSTIGPLSGMPKASAAFCRRIGERGVVVRELEDGELPTRISEVHALIHRAFQQQPFFSPIPLSVFAAGDRGDVGGAALIAERDGQLLAFVRGYPHPNAPDIWIVKTLARDPDCGVPGLGSYLLDCAHERARAAGHKRVLHALMHERNESRKCSARRGMVPLRSCVLLARAL